jgi:alanine-synthesizing transaminase
LVGRLRGQLTPLTRAIVLVSPSNPTGAALHEGDLPQLAELCRAHDLALICDEVFADYTTGSAARVPSLAGFDGVLTFVLSGLSKTCLLPQLKLGWIAVSGPPGATTEAVARLELIADSYLSVNTPVQVALPTILALRPRIQQRLIERLQANRAELVRATRGSPVSVLPSDGGWSAVLQVPRQLSEKAWVLEILEAANVLVHPGFFFDFETDGYLVLSLLVAEQSFGSGIAQLVRHVASRVR